MGNASQNASPAVILAVSKQPNINTLDVTEKIEANLREIQKSLPADVRMDTHIFRQADFIEASVNNVGRSLIEGALFAVVILFIFLASFRTTLISIIAIPLSLLGTCVVLYLLGMNINTMTVHRHRVAGGRCDYRRGKRVQAAAAKPCQTGGGAATRLYGRLRGLERDPRLHSERHVHHHGGIHSALLPLRHGGAYAQTAGNGLHHLAVHVADRGDAE